MINDEEADKIIISAFKYVVALQELIQTNLNFLVNCYLYERFKECIEAFPREMSNQDWSSLVPNDNTLDDSIEKVNEKISVIREALSDVQQMQASF